jgi:hypothetical protein
MTATDFPTGLLDLTGRVVFFPVRHHSPAAARLVRELITRLRPGMVLIEGPADFNDQFDELHFGHELPIAIYSYVQFEGGGRTSAYYPFCEYSPEWQAIQTAREHGIAAQFIDLPWAESAHFRLSAHRYADGEFRTSPYIDALCDTLGVESFDALWDTLFEIDPSLKVEAYVERCHRLCHAMRTFDERDSPSDRAREAYMAGHIRRALDETSGPVLVVTGGFHSAALFERLQVNSTDEPNRPAPTIEVRGIALTPYSFERLDGLAGYDSGMPNPGFYDLAWRLGDGDVTAEVLAVATNDLRKRKQTVSTADLIAVETTARALANLRAHARVWRLDLIDGVIGALVKDELTAGGAHPFLDALYFALRGTARGRLAAQTSLPLLTRDIKAILAEWNLEPTPAERFLELDLLEECHRAKSRVLHRLTNLGITGFDLVEGTNFLTREDLSKLWEKWRIRWTPEFDASCIEAAPYGATLAEAAANRLRERIGKEEVSAQRAAAWLITANSMGIEALSEELFGLLAEAIRSDGDFYGVAEACDHLVHLYRFDEVGSAQANPAFGELLREAFERALWLLVSLTPDEGNSKNLTDALNAVIRTFTLCGERIGLDRENLSDTLHRVSAAGWQSPLPRGAAAGALWKLGEADAEALERDIRACATPNHLGDYLTGLFALAREAAQRNPELLSTVDGALLSFTDPEFLESLPSLRLAFSFFTPREKFALVKALPGLGDDRLAHSVTRLAVSAETAAKALAFETELFEKAARYGIRTDFPIDEVPQ